MARYCPTVRQWSDRCYAAYVDDGSWFGHFVAVCRSRATAQTVARQASATRHLGQRRRRMSVPPVQVGAPPAALNPDDVATRDRSPQ